MRVNLRPGTIRLKFYAVERYFPRRDQNSIETGSMLLSIDRTRAMKS
jgi:hypothetical protein